MSPRSETTKTLFAGLIIIVALATAAIGYYEASHPQPPNAFPTSTHSSESVLSPSPTCISPTTTPQTPFKTTAPAQSSCSTPTPLPTPALTLPPISAAMPSPTPDSSPTQTPTPAPTSTPSFSEQTTQERVRDLVMNFISSNHPETAQFMTNLVWTGGRMTPPNLVGAEKYIYYSQGWNVTMTYPVVLNPTYNIVADYSATGISIPYRIIWNGTWQNEIINETSFVFAQ